MKWTPWTAYVVFTVLVLTAYASALMTAAPVAVVSLLSLAAMAGAITAMLYGLRRHRPASRWPWLLIMAQLLVTVTPALPPSVLAGGAHPTVTDALLLASSGVGALSLVLILRRRTPGWDLPGVVDAGIITVAAWLLSWIHVIHPAVGGAADLTARTVIAAYPLSDLLLATLGARLLLDAGPKSVAVRCITGYLALIIVPDTISSVSAFSGDDRWMPLAYLLWTASTLLLGLTGLHPSLRDVDARAPTATPDLSTGRLAALALASLVAPAALLVQYLRGAPLHVPVVCASCAALFLLVIARLAGLVVTQRRMAATDELTGLRTRRHFQVALNSPARQRSAAAVLLLDIDHFKNVNDTYGHDGGDRVLREVAHRLTGAVGAQGMVARYGGEEFAVLLPNVTPDQARAVAERIHVAVRDTPVEVGPDTAVTVTTSVGIACRPADGTESQHLTLLADQRLYEAKAAGRDRVVGYSTPVAAVAA
ncbi:diguanylate cyclase [Actinoplanes sp. CA-252034]|uniref:GGDEF domain-containing protein n=1 Tax=Actinoplanes sp. CA-252034 TaxID=3239906 RepID=UPI003D9783D1